MSIRFCQEGSHNLRQLHSRPHRTYPFLIPSSLLFISSCRQGSLNKFRKRLVNMAFDVLDKTGDGVVTIEDFAMAYDVSNHPDYLSGQRTKEELLVELLQAFDSGGEVDGKVTREEFEHYYAGISAAIDSDQYFELLIRNAWHISGGEGAAANSANLRVLVTASDGSERVVALENDLGLKQGDVQGIYRILLSQGVTDVVKINGMPVKAEPGSVRATHATANTASTAVAARRPSNASKSASKTATHSGAGKVILAKAGPGVKLLIEKLKKLMKARGSFGFVGMQRVFRIMDDDGSKSLNQGEFRKAMKEIAADLSDADIRALFEFFDADRSGSIDFEEFIQAVREPLSERRVALVKKGTVRCLLSLPLSLYIFSFSVALSTHLTLSLSHGLPSQPLIYSTATAAAW